MFREKTPAADVAMTKKPKPITPSVEIKPKNQNQKPKPTEQTYYTPLYYDGLCEYPMSGWYSWRYSDKYYCKPHFA